MPESLDESFLQQMLTVRDAKVFYKEIAIADAIIQAGSWATHALAYLE